VELEPAHIAPQEEEEEEEEVSVDGLVPIHPTAVTPLRGRSLLPTIWNRELDLGLTRCCSSG